MKDAGNYVKKTRVLRIQDAISPTRINYWITYHTHPDNG